MTSPRRRRSDRAGHTKLCTPGRPPVGRREDRRRFWAAIAHGLYPEAAVAEARVSWVVGARWFRQAGGMLPTHLAPSAPPLSGRYRSFPEREHLALLRAQGSGVRACARYLGRAPSTISRELRRNAATRSGGFAYRATTAPWHADRAVRRPQTAKLAAHPGLHQFVEERLAGVISSPDGTPCRGRAGVTAVASPGAGAGPGARNRLPIGFRWTFRTIRRCASVTRPSTKRSTCKAGGLFFFEEVTRTALERWLYQLLFVHPTENRFSESDFMRQLRACSLVPSGTIKRILWGDIFIGLARRAADPADR